MTESNEVSTGANKEQQLDWTLPERKQWFVSGGNTLVTSLVLTELRAPFLLTITAAVLLYMAGLTWPRASRRVRKFILAGLAALVLVSGAVIWYVWQPRVTLEFQPYVRVDRRDMQSNLGPMTFNNYSVVGVLRVVNNGLQSQQVKAIEAEGDIAMEYQEFAMAYLKEGDVMEKYVDEFKQRQPFRRLSIVAWPMDILSVDGQGGEAFIKFALSEPLNLGARVGGSVERSDYIGKRNPIEPPKTLTTAPALLDLVKLVPTQAKEPRFGLRDEIAKGELTLRVRLTSYTVDIRVESISRTGLTTTHEWDERVAQEMFHGGPWKRTEPVSTDPLIKR